LSPKKFQKALFKVNPPKGSLKPPLKFWTKIKVGKSGNGNFKERKLIRLKELDPQNLNQKGFRKFTNQLTSPWGIKN